MHSYIYIYVYFRYDLIIILSTLILFYVDTSVEISVFAADSLKLETTL